MSTGRVLLAAPRSFCAGVDRAIEIVELALEQRGAPVYVRKQIVHNEHVVADLVTGGIVRGGEIVGWPPQRWLLSWAANLYCRVLLGLRTHDCTSGFRCYTRELLLQIGLDKVVSQGYSFQIEMVHRARMLGYPVVEVPIRFEDRIAGASKVSRGEVRRALWTVLRLSLTR